MAFLLVLFVIGAACGIVYGIMDRWVAIDGFVSLFLALFASVTVLFAAGAFSAYIISTL